MSITIAQPTPTDLNTIHAFLSQSYWSPNIPREIVARACANSICAIARDEKDALIGFARVATDRATFAWLADVFVLPTSAGQGIGRDLVRTLQAHPELQNLRRWLLGTRDAHGVYAPLGFTALEGAERYMQIRDPAPYGAPAG
ncbi:MAG: GNAT family N-acetyltransferase [Terricaulis sp.]